MHSILEEFAYGNISPNTKTFKRNSQYDKTLSAVVALEKSLMQKLNEEEKFIFKQFVDAQGDIIQLTAVKNLVYGYKLGLLMTAEAFITSDDLVDGI